MSKFGKIGQTIFSLKVSKNYFSQVYGHNFGKNCSSSSILFYIGLEKGHDTNQANKSDDTKNSERLILRSMIMALV